MSLEAYLGKVVVVTTWASWCPQCRESLERADAAAETLDSAGISVLAINRTEPTARIERYLADLPELSHVTLIRDTADHFYKTTGGYAMPETVVIDKSGEVAAHFRGVFDTDAILAAARAAAE